MTSALSYVTTMYIAHKYEYQDVKETLLAVSNFVDVLDLQGNMVIENVRRNRQTLWGGCTDANPKLLLNDT